MIYRIASLDEMRMAFFSTMIRAAEAWGASRVFIFAPAQEASPDPALLFLAGAFIPGSVNRAELGGYEALAIRHGIFKMTVSALPEHVSNEAWELAQALENAFLPYTLDALPTLPTQAHDKNEPDFEPEKDEKKTLPHIL